MAGRFKLLALLVSVSLLGVGAPVAPVYASSAVAQPAPGGKTNFVVSVGGLYAGRTDNFARIGTYTFNPATGGVQGRWWHWNQSYRVGREATTTLSGTDCGVINCYVRTVKGFTGDADEGLAGTYTLNGQALAITWPGDLVERWTVTGVTAKDGSVDPSIVRLTWVGASANYRANVGYAWGSNASLAAYVPMREVASNPLYHLSYRYEHSRYYNGVVTPNLGSALNVNTMQPCNPAGTCIGVRNPPAPVKAGGCTHYPDGYIVNPDGSKTYLSDSYSYMGEVGKDRRAAYWGWTGCLAYDPELGRKTCYEGNSHTFPMLQAIDDLGRLRGWAALQVFYDMSGDNPLMDYFDVAIVYPYDSAI